MRPGQRKAPPAGQREALNKSVPQPNVNQSSRLRARAVALQFRCRAAEALEAGDHDEAAGLEDAADRLYSHAVQLGDDGVQVDRLDSGSLPDPRACDVCGREFVPARSTAKYCSPRCRQKSYRRDRYAKGGKSPGQRPAKQGVKGSGRQTLVSVTEATL